MKKIFKIIFSTLLLTLIASNALAKTDCSGTQILTAKTCLGDGLEPEEQQLYNMINHYRVQKRLPPIPLSSSLTLVANRHVRELAENIGSLTHAWSDCPYEGSNPNTWSCMWTAPQRLGTVYPAQGYEILYAQENSVSALAAFQNWQRNRFYHPVILNQGKWATPWQAIGIGIYQQYAAIWFGKQPEPTTVKLPLLPPLGAAQAIEVTSNKPILTTTTFAGGIAVGKGSFQNQVSVNLSDKFDIRGTIQVDPSHVGKTADIIAYAQVKLPNAKTPASYMLDKNGEPQPWNNDITQLLPFKSNIILKSVEPLKLYSGCFETAAIVQGFFGYRLPLGDGRIVWVHNSQPIDLKIK